MSESFRVSIPLERGFHAQNLINRLRKSQPRPTERLRFHIDLELLFWPHHFSRENGNYEWATNPNGIKKGCTLRFRQGVIRVPATHTLPVYETEEFIRGELPRVFQSISRVVVGTMESFTPEELALDGYENAAHGLERMSVYYPGLTMDSLFSLYIFGESHYPTR